MERVGFRLERVALLVQAALQREQEHYISPISPLYLRYISPISFLYLRCISPISPRQVCSLLGNVSKHGDAFYAHMLAAGLLPLLVDGCADADGATRKLACFAVGNAGFHSAVLHLP